MLLYLDDSMSQHDTGKHPECPDRILLVNKILRDRGWDKRSTCPQWQEATREQLQAVHEVAYIDRLKNWCEMAAGRIESDTVVSRGSWSASLRAAGAAIDAVQRVMQGEDKLAFCAIRATGSSCSAQRADGVLPVQQCSHRCARGNRQRGRARADRRLGRASR